MNIQDAKITSSDLANKGVVGLPDTPNLSTLVMQQKFDEIATDVIVPKFNALIDELEADIAPIVSENPVAGETFIYDADDETFKNGMYYTSLADLKDASVENVQNRDFLCYDEESGKWFPTASSGSVETISACEDTSITNPQTNDVLKWNGNKWANTPDSEGLLAKFVITSEEGATVTATAPSGATKTLTVVSGKYVCDDIDEYGEWTVTCAKDGDSESTTITVDAVKIYTASITLFSATIAVTYPSGATVTCAKDSTTYTATGSPYTFTVRSSGTWTVTCSKGGVTKTQTFSITTNGQAETYNFTPVGASATPTDSVETLCLCAGIWDSTITTIAELLADTSSLQTVITTNNSADYLARSTTFASSVTADSNAMSYIGLNNYCANKLLAVSDWVTAICGSTYFESLLNVKVPVMTSATAPSGQVIYSTQGASDAAWKAFDGLTTTKWTASAAAPQHIGYMFTQSVKVYKLYLRSRTGTTTYMPTAFKLQGSNDNSTWNDVETYSNAVTSGSVEFVNTTTANYKYWRIYVTSASGSGVSLMQLQFYGRVDV